MVRPGAMIDPTVPLTLVRGGGVERMTLGELLTRPTVISIYLRNRTTSCDRQVEELVAVAAEVAAAGCQLVAVSRDSPGSHRRQAEARGVTFPLISDPEDRLARALDVIVAKSMYGKIHYGPARTVLVLGTDGRVRAVAAKVDVKTHAEQVRALVAEARGG